MPCIPIHSLRENWSLLSQDIQSKSMPLNAFLRHFIAFLIPFLLQLLSQSLRNFTNLTAKEYQFAVQKLLFCVGPGTVPCSLLPEHIATPLRKLLMMTSDLLMFSSLDNWSGEMFRQVIRIGDQIGPVYKEVFFRPASYKKKDKVRISYHFLLL
jgi:hypothetical protein